MTEEFQEIKSEAEMYERIIDAQRRYIDFLEKSNANISKRFETLLFKETDDMRLSKIKKRLWKSSLPFEWTDLLNRAGIQVNISNMILDEEETTKFLDAYEQHGESYAINHLKGATRS